jgi:hypothetical protein
VLDNDHHEAVAEDEVGVELDDEQVEAHLDGLQLNVEAQHDERGDGVDEQREKLKSSPFLDAVGAVAGVGGQKGDDEAGEEDDVLAE